MNTKKYKYRCNNKRFYELHSNICKTLANPKRLEILNILDNQELTAGELTELTGISKANLSQHLAILRNVGVVSTRREGTNIFYRISNPKITKACLLIREVLLEQLESMKNLTR